MPSPYDLDLHNSCVDCSVRAERQFCNLSPATVSAMEARREAHHLIESLMLQWKSWRRTESSPRAVSSGPASSCSHRQVLQRD